MVSLIKNVKCKVLQNVAQNNLLIQNQPTKDSPAVITNFT